MKKFMSILLLLLVFFGCSKNENLEKKFKNTIIDYQKKFPIPIDKKLNNKRVYIYSAYFLKKKQDTIFILSRNSAGLLPNTKGFGIYQDDILKPTFIIDDSNYSKKFILKKIKKVDKKYIWFKEEFPEGTPPIYTYSAKGINIQLIKIDTIWNHWD